ncbi:carbohydrate-binding module family 48 protein [Aspergillus ibericus CBS 121593]|uniref:AMP-activated protein kinase glycogen-binding domain-containing protein n=1 Tax=Aspergillus ibericus CBS 121593 TaxID=1448316 RepID=A0A395GW59_9EURO|nr:hypothetical protein BO80DRAFT_426189 [Aspergillus ibericus CBS 121593]RAK99811.1 hypothetical protein BO80DRAFT_426189 [Aspergillus ibericus CBS 121593]
MGSFTFRWPYSASEVFVTGTFDDWGKTVQLDRIGDGFEKEVSLPATDEKIHYKFVVDGFWTTDSGAPEEDDGNNNINNVLYPDQIQEESTDPLLNGTATMSGVRPDSTTAALAAGIPKESSSKYGQSGYYPTISSAAPGSTTAGLGQDVPLEQRASVPGSYPATPASETEKFSVNPIPASSGTGNPIKLNPGEKVPDASTFNPNTIYSTARTDQAGYEQGGSSAFAGSNFDGSAFSVPPVSKNMIPESSLPMGDSPEATQPTYTIQSVAPMSTTAGLAAAVPLESQRHTTSGLPATDVPDVVRQSLSDAHKDPEAATSETAVEEKREMEEELRQKVPVDNSPGTPAPVITSSPATGLGAGAAGLGTAAGLGAATLGSQRQTAGDVPDVVKQSISEGYRDPEAATSEAAVGEKKVMEEELQQKVPVDNSPGTPAPAITSTGIGLGAGVAGLGTAAGLGAATLGSQKQTTGGLPAEDVPDVVKQSITDAHEDPEAAVNEEAVEEKREMEEELQRRVPVNNQAGAPAPALTAATTETAPRATGEPAPETAGPVGTASTTEIPRATDDKLASGQVSPRNTDSTDGPTVTTGVGTAKTSAVSGPGAVASEDTSHPPTAGATGASATKTVDSGVESGPTADETTTPTAGATGASATKTADSANPAETEASAGTTGSGPTNGAAKPANTTNGKEKKKKGFFLRLKEKLKSV